MKILHVFPVTRQGGVPKVVLSLIQNDPQNQHLVATQKGDEILFNEFQKHAHQVFELQLLTLNLATLWALNRLIRKEKPDIVHAHGKGALFYVFLCTLLSLGKKFGFIHTFHGFKNKFSGIAGFLYPKIERLISLVVDRYIAVSESEKQVVIQHAKIPEAKIQVIHNCVDVNHQSLPDSYRAKMQGFEQQIVTLSRISYQKDLETMLRAMAIVRQSFPKAGLHIMGGYIDTDLANQQKVQSLLKELRLEDNVLIWGEVHQASSYLHEFDLYWSTARWEGLPTAIIEAMLSQIPVVATAVTGNIDLVEHQKTGLLTKVEDAQTNADAVCQIFANPNLAKSLASEALAFVGGNFSLNRYVTSMSHLYQEVKHESSALK